MAQALPKRRWRSRIHQLVIGGCNDGTTHSRRNFDRHRTDGASVDLPLICGENLVIEGDVVALRFAMQMIEDR